MMSRRELPKIDVLLSVDPGHDDYASFMYEFGPQMVGAPQWRFGLENKGNFSKIVSAPDEAFLLMSVLNNWNRVVDGSVVHTPDEKEEMFHKETYAKRDVKNEKEEVIGYKIIGYYTEGTPKEDGGADKQKET